MKTRTKSIKRPEGHPERRIETAAAADFHRERMHQERAIELRKQSSVKPAGTYEYEQLIAEEAGSNAHPLIEKAAYFLAQARHFAPGGEMADWLQAEAEVEVLLRRAH
jgi:hypothetical protein